MNDRELLEARGIEKKNWMVTVSYPKHTCSKSHAWSHLEHNYPEGVPTGRELKRHNYNPWRKSHSATHWAWYAKLVIRVIAEGLDVTYEAGEPKFVGRLVVRRDQKFELPPSKPLPHGDPTLAKYNFKRRAMWVGAFALAFLVFGIAWEFLK